MCACQLRIRFRFIATVLAVVVSIAIQESDKASAASAAEVEPSIRVIDEAGKATEVTASQLAKLPREAVKVKDHGKDAEFEGASLAKLLMENGVEFGDSLRGRRVPSVILLEATDGYRAVVSLVEIDPGTTDKMAIVADHRDGQPLGGNEAPFRLIIPGEKRAVRWIRAIRTIRILNLRDFPLEEPPSERGEALR